MINEFAAAMRKLLRDDMNNATDDVATGSCRNFDDYKYVCGKIHGLAMAERHLLDLMEKVERGE